MNARSPRSDGDRRTNMVDSVGTTAWRYDEAGRLVGESGPFGTPEVQVAYDPNGRLTNVTWGAFSVDYAFDDLSRIVSVSAPEGAYAFTYLSNGIRRATVAYPNGVTEVRAHDELARCTSLAFLSGTNPLLSIAYAYDEGDCRTNEVWSTGRAMSYGYDAAHQLTSVDAARPSDAARYRYDAAGNPVDRAELGLDVTNAFNNLNQIVTGSWTGSTLTVAGTVNYPVGSITVNGQPGTVYPDSSFDVANVPVAPGTNTLTATYTGPAYTNAPMTATDSSTVVLGDTAYTHDANGNLTSDATFTYQYDLANQLTNVIRKADNTTVLSCRYDALGRRVEAIRADGTVDRYVYFPGSFLVLAVLDEANAPKEFYTRGPDLSGTLASVGGIGGILACTYASGPVLYHHADLIGNVIALTDASASLLSTFRYTPFGQLTLCTGTVFPRHLFASKEWEAEIGAAYFGFRHYVPRLERWLTRDPLGEAGGIGLYRHGFANPFLGVDSWGLYFGESVVNGLGTIGEWTWQGVSAVGKGLWTVGEWGVQGAVATGQGALWLGDELLTMGRVMGGNAWGILSGDALWREKRPHISLETGQCSVLITVTGIRNEMDDQWDFNKSISGLSPFNSIANPVYIDNPTHYFGIGDAMQILGHEIGLIQEVDQDVAHVINEAAQKLRAQNCCCWRIYVVAHSQGTMIVQRSLSLVESEAKSHLYIVGLGGETSFNAQRDGLAYAHNIANKHDLVFTIARLIVPLEAGDRLDYFEDDNRFLDAHNFQKSYLPYLEHHAGSIVP